MVACLLIEHVIERRPVPSADDIADLLAQHKPAVKDAG
jgi:hypothetical protein